MCFKAFRSKQTVHNRLVRWFFFRRNEARRAGIYDKRRIESFGLTEDQTEFLKTMVDKNYVSKFQFNEKREALKYAAKEQLWRH